MLAPWNGEDGRLAQAARSPEAWEPAVKGIALGSDWQVGFSSGLPSGAVRPCTRCHGLYISRTGISPDGSFNMRSEELCGEHWVQCSVQRRHRDTLGLPYQYPVGGADTVHNPCLERCRGTGSVVWRWVSHMMAIGQMQRSHKE